MSANQDPYQMKLSNPNAEDEDNSAIVYLITQRDDNINTLILTIQNVSGAPVNFTADTPFVVSMNAVLPKDVITGIQVQPLPSGWRSSVYTVGPKVQGLKLSPVNAVALAENDSLTFTFVNIVFTQAEIDDWKSPQQPYFQVTYSVPESGGVPLLVCVTPRVESKPLLHFDADFITVNKTLCEWNVQVNTEKMWIGKEDDQVYSNSNTNLEIQTRLAFSLINKDSSYDLTLNSSSQFTVLFLAGDGYGQLTIDQNLIKIDIKEISTNHWDIKQAQDFGVSKWTLTPNAGTTLAAKGGHYDFLIDAVLANDKPTLQDSGVALTQMYILYQNVPARTGNGNYADGYLATTIKKIVPEPHVVSFNRVPSQDQDPLDIGAPVTLSWEIFGVAAPTLQYIDSDNTPKNVPVNFTDHLQVYPPGYALRNRTSTYQLMSGSTQLEELSVTTKSIPGMLPGKTLIQDDDPPALSWEKKILIKVSSIAFNTESTCTINFTSRTDGQHIDPDWSANGTWSTQPKDNDSFIVTIVMDYQNKIIHDPGGDITSYKLTAEGQPKFDIVCSVKDLLHPQFTSDPHPLEPGLVDVHTTLVAHYQTWDVFSYVDKDSGVIAVINATSKWTLQ